MNSNLISDRDYLVYIMDDHIMIEHKTSQSHLQIDRSQYELSIVNKPTITEQNVKSGYGILGIYKMKASNYIGLITHSKYVGQIVDNKIHKVEKVEFISIGSKHILKEDQPYLDCIQNILQYGHFYFSKEYDLTKTLQENINDKMEVSKWNENYFWNISSSQDLIEFPQFITQVISGYFEQVTQKVEDKEITIGLLSRREKNRQGYRFISRGADLDGNVSNYAQTEQFVEINQNHSNKIYSFIQTRGSIPFIWSQKPDLKWSPKVQILNDIEQNQEVASRHFNQQFKQEFQQKQIMINLIDKKGSQLQLGQHFQNIVEKINDNRLRYIWFDFHHECKNLKYHNLSKLIQQINREYDQIGMLSIEKKNQQMTINSIQKGVFRTNCVDCLDRTNVVQSVIARNIVNIIFLRNGLQSELSSENVFQSLPIKLESQFKSMWANNADIMSMFYTGTPALKTDFTRTGKRSYYGALQDGKNSIHRYVLNNFYDGYNQDSLDFFLSKLTIDSVSPKPSYSFFYVLLIIIMTSCLIKKTHDQYQTEQTGFTYATSLIFILLTIQFTIFKGIQSNYSAFLKKPTLKQ